MFTTVEQFGPSYRATLAGDILLGFIERDVDVSLFVSDGSFRKRLVDACIEASGLLIEAAETAEEKQEPTP